MPPREGAAKGRERAANHRTAGATAPTTSATVDDRPCDSILPSELFAEWPQCGGRARDAGLLQVVQVFLRRFRRIPERGAVLTRRLAHGLDVQVHQASQQVVGVQRLDAELSQNLSGEIRQV